MPYCLWIFSHSSISSSSTVSFPFPDFTTIYAFFHIPLISPQLTGSFTSLDFIIRNGLFPIPRISPPLRNYSPDFTAVYRFFFIPGFYCRLKWNESGRARYLSVTEAPHNTDFHTWMGKKHFCFFQTAETGNRTPQSGVKGSDANHYPRAHALNAVYRFFLIPGFHCHLWICFFW